MINSTDKKCAVAAGLKQAAMAGSALALVMGVASPASATVVTTTLGTPVTLSLTTAGSSVFDINNDSINDFTLMSSGGCSATTTCSISVVPGTGNRVYINGVAPGPGPQAARLSSFNAFKQDFYGGNVFKYMSPNPGNLAESTNGLTTSGDWGFNGATGVLGLEFQVGGQDYLGYIHGTTSDPTNDTNLSIAFDSYGYDTTAVPESDTLALLAMGMVGVGVLRRRRKTVKA